MFGGMSGGAGYVPHTDDDNYDDLDLPPYLGSFNFGESGPDLVEDAEVVVDGESFFNASSAPEDYHLSSSTIATDDGGMLDDLYSDDYDLDSATSASMASGAPTAASGTGVDKPSPSQHTELDLANPGSTKVVESQPISMSQPVMGATAVAVSSSVLAAAALSTEYDRLDSTSMIAEQAEGDANNTAGSSLDDRGDDDQSGPPPSPPTKTGGKRKTAAVVAAAGVGLAGLATVAVYGNRILKRFRNDDGDNEEAANYEVQDQDLGGDIYAEQQGQGPGQGQAQPQGQGQTGQGPSGAEQGAAQAAAQAQLQVAQAMVAQASSGIASAAGAVGGAAGAAAAAAAAATAAGETIDTCIRFARMYLQTCIVYIFIKLIGLHPIFRYQTYVLLLL